VRGRVGFGPSEIKSEKLSQYKISSNDVLFIMFKKCIIIVLLLCRSSCGLWMLNFMEYWTGDILSDNFDQVYFTLYHGLNIKLLLFVKTNYDYYLIG
jgi:hypothetical protein